MRTTPMCTPRHTHAREIPTTGVEERRHCASEDSGVAVSRVKNHRPRSTSVVGSDYWVGKGFLVYRSQEGSRVGECDRASQSRVDPSYEVVTGSLLSSTGCKAPREGPQGMGSCGPCSSESCCLPGGDSYGSHGRTATDQSASKTHQSLRERTREACTPWWGGGAGRGGAKLNAEITIRVW